MKNLTQRNYSMDFLRVLACYMVIQIHAGEFYYIGEGGTTISSDESFWIGILNSLFRTAVPLFIMISGYFLLPVKDKMDTFFKKRFTRVVIPFIVWCALYAFYQFFRGEATLGEAGVNILKTFVNFGVEVGHLWYIYMLIGLYLFAPIISPWLATTSKQSIQLYLVLWGISLSLPYIHLIFPEFWGECFWNQTPLLYYFSGFLGYMVLAFYIRTYLKEKSRTQLLLSLFLIVAGYCITAGGFIYQLDTAEYIPQLELTWGFETINVAMMATGLFLLFRNLSVSGSSPLTAVVADISRLSYGIYLIHIMVLNFFYEWFNPMFGSFVVKLLVISVCTFVMSYLIVKLISYLPKSKYIVG